MERFQPKLILSPVDFSELSSLALRYAQRMEKCFDAKLLVLHAENFMPPVEFTSGQVDQLIGEFKLAREAVLGRLKEYTVNLLGHREAAETLVVDGRAVPAIVKVARERGAGLIVMGTHGRSGLSRVMLGSVTERVLRETDVPVLTVRPHDPPLGEAPGDVRRILCPVNFSSIAMKALEHAVSLAKCFGGELQVLFVRETGSGEAPDPEQMSRLCQWIPDQLRSGCRIEERLRHGSAAEEIIKFAGAQGCGLIVLGAQHRKFFDTTVLGTTTVRVTRHAPCPVFTVVQKPVE
jgi:nucleotide-binding universal stress UspA family protein